MVIYMKKRKKIEFHMQDFEKIKEQSKREGYLEHAGKTLSQKFTEEELAVIFNMIWFSEPMNSMRMRIVKLEKKIME